MFEFFWGALGFDTSMLSHLFGAFLLSIDVMGTASIFRRVLTGGHASNPFAVSQWFSTFAFVILCCGCLVKSFVAFSHCCVFLTIHLC